MQYGPKHPNKMNDLILECNLSQLITENTHFTEHSSSQLDLILVRNNNNNNILMSGTLDPLIPDQIYSLKGYPLEAKNAQKN